MKEERELIRILWMVLVLGLLMGFLSAEATAVRREIKPVANWDELLREAERDLGPVITGLKESNFSKTE